MSEFGLSEIDLHDGSQRIRLRRELLRQAPAVAPPPMAPVAAPATAEKEPQTESPAKKLVEIKSPTPGTFYAAPSPDSAPYVKVGAQVSPTTVVCQIEAMKIFNEITADCSGVITEIEVENGQPVEWGQVLFRVDPSG